MHPDSRNSPNAGKLRKSPPNEITIDLNFEHIVLRGSELRHHQQFCLSSVADGDCPPRRRGQALKSPTIK
jgi:hypothetical protein